MMVCYCDDDAKWKNIYNDEVLNRTTLCQVVSVRQKGLVHTYKSLDYICLLLFHVIEIR